MYRPRRAHDPSHLSRARQHNPAVHVVGAHSRRENTRLLNGILVSEFQAAQRQDVPEREICLADKQRSSAHSSVQSLPSFAHTTDSSVATCVSRNRLAVGSIWTVLSAATIVNVARRVLIAQASRACHVPLRRERAMLHGWKVSEPRFTSCLGRALALSSDSVPLRQAQTASYHT